MPDLSDTQRPEDDEMIDLDDFVSCAIAEWPLRVTSMRGAEQDYQRSYDRAVLRLERAAEDLATAYTAVHKALREITGVESAVAPSFVQPVHDALAAVRKARWRA